MKLLFVILALIFGFTSMSQAAKNNKCCFCEIGNEPASQQGFFRSGCNMWLREQRDCTTKEVVAQNTDYAEKSLACDGGTLNVGYVGHWYDSNQMVDYLNERIVPVMNTHHVSAVVDNTGCSAMNHPALIVDYVKNLNLPRNQSLVVIGNQTESVGEWDHFLGRASNFTAVVSSLTGNVTYPACKNYENYNCIQQVQMNQPAHCIDRNSHIKTLYCCGVSADITRSNSTKYVWTTQDQCTQQ